MLNKKMTIEHILLELRDGPQFRVAILTYRDQRLVVQPGQSGHLTLSVGICNQSVGFTTFHVTFSTSLLLMMMCFAGFSTDQMMMLVSKLPLATNNESGDQATLLTRALWKPHS
jgi:hypothetical protein